MYNPLNMTRRIVFTFFLTLLILTVAVSTLRAEIIDRIVAKVGSEVITLSELEDATRQSELEITEANKVKALQALIDTKLLLEAARKENIELPDAKINLQVEFDFKSFKKNNFASDEDFQQWLIKNNISEDGFKSIRKERIRQEILIGRLLRKKTPAITDDDVKQYTLQHPDEAKQKESIRVRQIFFEVASDTTAEEKEKIHQSALKAYHELKLGKKFEDVLMAYAQDSDNIDATGDLGYISHGDSLPALETTAYSMELMGISEPILTENGYHILQVTEKASIREFLFNEAIKGNRDKLIAELRKSTPIIIK